MFWTFVGRLRDIQIVIITNFVVVSSVGIKRVDYIAVRLMHYYTEPALRPSFDSEINHIRQFIRIPFF